MTAQVTVSSTINSGSIYSQLTASVTLSQVTYLRKKDFTSWGFTPAGTHFLHNIATGSPLASSGVAWSGNTTANTAGMAKTTPIRIQTWEYNYTGSGVPAGSFDIVVPATNFLFTYGGSGVGSIYHTLEPVTISLGAPGSSPVVNNPNTNPPPITTLEKFFGENLNLPYYVPDGVTNVAVELNGQTYNFPVTDHKIFDGGVAMLDLPIPQGWNGAAKINGVDVALAPRIAFTGDAVMAYTANPYQDATEPLALPPGMTRGVPAMPGGMTPQSYYGLPAGMTAATKLPLPAGVTAITQTAPVGGTLPVGVTKTGGTSGWVTIGPTQTAKTGTTATPTTVGVITGKNSELTQADQDAIGEAGAVGDYSSDKKEPGLGLKGLATQWDALKVSAQNKFGAFRPLQSGSLPKETAINMNFNFGQFGSRSVNIDLTQPPFSTARAIALVLLIAGSGWWFMNFLRV